MKDDDATGFKSIKEILDKHKFPIPKDTLFNLPELGICRIKRNYKSAIWLEHYRTQVRQVKEKQLEPIVIYSTDIYRGA